MAIGHFEILSVPVSDQEHTTLNHGEVLGYALIGEAQMGSGARRTHLPPCCHSVTMAPVAWLGTKKLG